MKHPLLRLLTLLGCLAAAPLGARAQAPDSLRQALDAFFAPLDKSQVPVAYLEEYGNRLAPLRPCDGTLSDSSVSTLAAWRLRYASVLGANVGRPSLLPPPADLTAALDAQTAATPTAIPLLVQRLNYATLRPDALTAGLLSYSGGQLHDVPGRTQSPYLARTLFAAVPGRNVSTTGAVSFVFASSLYVQRGGGGMQALSIHFGDGRGYRPAAWNQPVGASYCTAGTYRIKVRVAYSSPVESRTAAGLRPPVAASNYESQFDLRVLQAGCPADRYATYQRINNFPATSAHSGAYPASPLGQTANGVKN